MPGAGAAPVVRSMLQKLSPRDRTRLVIAADESGFVRDAADGGRGS